MTMFLTLFSIPVIAVYGFWFGILANCCAIPDVPASEFGDLTPIEDVTPLHEAQEEESVEDEDVDPTIYVQFVMNTHDWVMIDLSIETIHRLIDIHEKYDVPVDIYLTDPVVQGYMEHDPSLIERMAASDVVAVNHHARPPSPYYSQYDWLGLGEMSDDDLYDTLYRYQTEKIDLETGQTTGEPGGITYIAELVGYMPLITGISAQSRIGKTLSEIYSEMGALFLVQHGTLPYRLGDMYWNQYLRPEHVAIKLYEEKTVDAESVIEEFLVDAPVGEEDVYLNIKYHENNFYSANTTFAPVYWEDYDSGRQRPHDPPWDLSLGNTDLKTEGRQAQLWALWENAVKYVAENPDRFTAINAFDLKEMVEALEKE